MWACWLGQQRAAIAETNESDRSSEKSLFYSLNPQMRHVRSVPETAEQTHRRTLFYELISGQLGLGVVISFHVKPDHTACFSKWRRGGLSRHLFGLGAPSMGKRCRTVDQPISSQCCAPCYCYRLKYWGVSWFCCQARWGQLIKSRGKNKLVTDFREVQCECFLSTWFKWSSVKWFILDTHFYCDQAQFIFQM